MTRSVLVALLFAMTAIPVAAKGVPADLAAAVKEYDRAQIEGDRAALESVLADDYILVNSQAKIETKAQFIGELTKPGDKIDPYTVQEPIEKIWRDGAVMAGLVTLSGIGDGQAFKVTIRFADIWAKRRGKWQVVFTEVTRVPERAR